jgi:thiol peroxidase
MKIHPIVVMFVVSMYLVLTGCVTTGGPKIQVDTASSTPGGSVTQKGEPRRLVGTPLTIGAPLPSTVLVDAVTMEKVDLARMRGKVLLLSLVPSLDTKVCEAQTHLLGEEGDRLPQEVVRITISRDTPFAQKRFAEEAKLTDLTYLSDYRDGSFGRATGLLVEESLLLARAVILVDQGGVVRSIQVVPELSHLPDMESAFSKATALAAETATGLLPWLPLKEGMAKAKAENKTMIVDFYYGKGCPRCEFLQSQAYDDPGIAEKIRAAFVPIRIDLTTELSPEEEALGKKFDFKNECLLLFLDPHGNVIVDPDGTKLCFIDKVDPDQFIRYLERFQTTK